MASAPTLNAAQWQLIVDELPATRRDRLMISAILFRVSSGQSVRETAAVFGVAKTKLHEWGTAVEPVLPGILQTLRLEPAGPRMRRAGGADWRKRSGIYEGVSALRLQDFGQALRRTR